MQINLTGFLTDSTPAFMVALWNLLIEAQASPAGIPHSFVEEKKEEMRRAKEGDTRALAERDRRMRLDDIRERERSERTERGGGRGRGRGRRGRGGIGNDDNRTRDNGWSSRGGAVSLASNRSHEHTSHLLHRSSVRDIALLRVLERLPYVAGHLLVTGLLAPAASLLVVLVLAVQFVHVPLHLLAVDLPHREAHLLPHRAVTVAAAAVRHHTRHVSKSGIVGAEDATAVVLQRDVDAPAHPHAAVLRVEARTIHVADAVQAPVAVEGIAPSQAHGPRRAGEGAREIGAGVKAGVGARMQRMAGVPKGRLVGAEAGPGVRARAGPKTKVGAKHEMLALRTVQPLGSGSKARPRLSGRETKWSLGRCVVSFDVY
jgi:PWI domain